MCIGIACFGDKVQLSTMFTILKQGSMYCKVLQYLQIKSLTQQAPFHWSQLLWRISVSRTQEHQLPFACWQAYNKNSKAEMWMLQRYQKWGERETHTRKNAFWPSPKMTKIKLSLQKNNWGSSNPGFELFLFYEHFLTGKVTFPYTFNRNWRYTCHIFKP